MKPFDHRKALSNIPGRIMRELSRESRLDLEKELADYREHVAELQNGLEEARATFEANERAAANIRRVRHRLIGARSLCDLIETLHVEFGNLGVQEVALVLAEDVIGRDIAAGRNAPESVAAHLAFMPHAHLLKLLAGDGGVRPYLGEYKRSMGTGLFGHQVRSCALLPLLYQDRLIGCIKLGAHSPKRYCADHDTDLLEDLAATAALCLDSVLTHERNRRLAVTDPLTGLFNRRYFYAQAAQAFALAKRHGDPLTIIYIDLNDFKPVNDTYGHDAGDLVLKKVSRRVQERVRQTDVFARLGGDEFALLLPRVGFGQAGQVVEWLRQQISEVRFGDEGLPEISLSASFGLAVIEPEDQFLDDMMGRADAAMYEDKARIKAARRKA